MASLGHIAVGAAASRIYRAAPIDRPSLAAVLFWSSLSFLPDADVIGCRLGVPYEAAWGHRGATHSFAFALAVGVAAGIVAGLLRRRGLRTGAMAAVVVASHPLLDILTDGGLGCALFWPFDGTRYFAPWRPIPVAPIGLAFFSPFGLTVASGKPSSSRLSGGTRSGSGVRSRRAGSPFAPPEWGCGSSCCGS